MSDADDQGTNNSNTSNIIQIPWVDTPTCSITYRPIGHPSPLEASSISRVAKAHAVFDSVCGRSGPSATADVARALG